MYNTNRKAWTQRLEETPPASRLPPLLVAAAAAAIVLGGCGTTAPRRTAEVEATPGSATTSPGVVTRRGGGYYLDDGPGDNPPPDLHLVPDAVPRAEPLHRGALRPYTVMGRSYTPMTELVPYRSRGVASWYGRRYHGKPTSSGERYDMYGMTAAHPVLPIPSYARVTHVRNGRSVVVRINDRGPFIGDRLIDLSYTAAYKLGILDGGSALVEVETITPDRYAEYAARPAASAASAAGQGEPPDAIAAFAASDAAPLVPAAEPVALVSPGAEAPPLAGVYLQLGAFGSRDNAESYRSRVQAELEDLGARVYVMTHGGYYRVHAGPYETAAQARAAAERMAQALGTRPLLVYR